MITQELVAKITNTLDLIRETSIKSLQRSGIDFNPSSFLRLYARSTDVDGFPVVGPGAAVIELSDGRGRTELHSRQSISGGIARWYKSALERARELAEHPLHPIEVRLDAESPYVLFSLEHSYWEVEGEIPSSHKAAWHTLATVRGRLQRVFLLPRYPHRLGVVR